MILALRLASGSGSTAKLTLSSLSGAFKLHLKEHYHGDFPVCYPKRLKYLTKNLFSNMKLLLEHGEENMK